MKEVKVLEAILIRQKSAESLYSYVSTSPLRQPPSFSRALLQLEHFAKLIELMRAHSGKAFVSCPAIRFPRRHKRRRRNRFRSWRP